METPSGWKTLKMPQVVLWSSGGTPKATERLYYENGTIPWLVIGDLNDGIVTSSASKITSLGLQNSSAKMMPDGTLLVAMYGSIGKLGITGMPCCTNQAIAFAKELYGVTTKYMFYYLSFIKPRLISAGKGGTQKNISLSVLNSLDVIVPSIDEQERIVAHIEELFSELDAGEETLQKIKKQLSVYHQAVLKEAFSGKLTGTSMASCERLTNYIEKPRYGTSKKCGYETKEVGTPVYRIPNIEYSTGRISHQDIKYAVFDSSELQELQLLRNDILLIRSNGSVNLVGRAALVGDDDLEGVFAGYLMRLRIVDKQKLSPAFLLHFLNSQQARSYIENKAKSTSGVNNINSKEIADIPIPVCGIDEQKRIVEAIESRLSICDSIEETVEKARQQAAAMRQSILKQAFEGGAYAGV